MNPNQPYRVVLQRLARLAAVVIFVTLMTTVMISVSDRSPGEVVLGPEATQEQVAAFDEKHGYDRPVIFQYLHWLGGAVRGDLGTSVVSGQSVAEIIGTRLPVTLEIAFIVLIISVMLAIVFALVAVAKPGGVADRALTMFNGAFLSLPSFATGLLIVLVATIYWQLLPPAGWVPFSEDPSQHFRHLIAPCLTLVLAETPALAAVLRADLGRTLSEEYIEVARTKGLSRTYILLRHALRPSVSGFLALSGVSLGRLLSGMVIIESIFALPGVGQLIIQSVYTSDLPLIQGIVALLGILYVAVNAGLETLYAIIDPRIRT